MTKKIDKTEALRQALIKELDLNKKKIDFSRIAELSDNLVALDQTAFRFTVDARHVHRLGYELVGKQETALSELIKNAYDADATEVIISFSDYEEPGGILIIKDDGHGMTREVIQKDWMTLSTSDKETNPVSPRYNRSRAGRKGIGRFAVERLGKRLILNTEVEGEELGTRVIFDWDTLYQHGSALTRIPNKIESYKKDAKAHGTTLVIEELRDRWTEFLFDKVWKSVLLLQPPFQPARITRIKKAVTEAQTIDPGFHVLINGRDDKDVLAELSIEKTFLQHRTALFRGRIDERGKASFSLESKVLKFRDETLSEQRFLLVGPVEFEISYFIYEAGLMSGVSLVDARTMGNKYGGVRIYRDGFRVLPYGEPFDDWLKLSFEAARRIRLAPSNNLNFFGHIELSSESNPLFEETSSREGLIENEAYAELQQFVRSCIDWGTKRIAWARGRKQESSQKDFKPRSRKPSEVTQEILSNLETGAHASDEATQEARQLLEKGKEEQVQFEEEVERREREHAQYDEVLRILASLGISISVFGHEVRGAMTRVASEIKQLRDILDSGPDVSQSREVLKKVDENIDRMFELGAYVVGLIDQSKSRDKKEIALYAAIVNFTKQFTNYLDARSIQIDFSVSPEYLRTKPMHPSEIDSVLFNFLTNSVKAMDKTGAKERKIKISAESRDSSVVLSFQDTGGGVSEDIRHKIFDAFFTTIEYSDDVIAGPGSGLGLKIVSDIASANGGVVQLVDPEPGYSCKFEFIVPQAT
jgi:signal transduction histidine kinase